MKKIFTTLILVILSQQAVAVTVTAGIQFLDIANTVDASVGSFATNDATQSTPVNSAVDGNAASYIWGLSNPSTLDVSFSGAADVADVDLTLLFVGSNPHTGTVSLFGGSGGISAAVPFSLTPYDAGTGTFTGYTGFNSGTFGIFSLTINLADKFGSSFGTFTGVKLNIYGGAYDAAPSLIGTTTGTRSAPAIKAGDLAPLNQPDGVLNAGDVVVMERLVLGQLEPTQEQSLAADVAPLNHPDGQINTGDLLVLMRAVSGAVTLPSINAVSGGVEPPYLVPPTSPTQQSSITVQGTASPQQSVNLYVNGTLAASSTADSQGGFQSTVNLQVGPNSLYAVGLVGAIEGESSNLVSVFYGTELPPVDWQNVVLTNIGNGETTVEAGVGTVAAGQTVELTSRSGETKTIVANRDGSFSAVFTSNVESVVTNASVVLGTYEFNRKGLADQVQSFTGTGVYNGTDFINPVLFPSDIIDDLATTFISTLPNAGYDNVAIDLGFSQAQIINSNGADLALFFLFDPSNNEVKATINGVTNSLIFSNLYDQSGTQQVANGVIWNGQTLNNVQIKVAEVDLSNFGVAQGVPMRSALSIQLNQIAPGTEVVALSLVGALNIAPLSEPEPITVVVKDSGGNVSLSSGNKAVGSLSGTFIVNETGAATYTIPIEVPPGIAGMQPELSLNYNSQSGNGLLGIGWSLSGLSAITRCPKTYAQDAAYGAVSYDSNDRFCLDGQRLVNVAGSYGADGTVYRTEVDSFSLITQNGTGCGGPCGFTVQTKSGQTIVYGNTDNSRRNVSTTSAALHWAVNSITDVTGNSIQFTYYKNTSGDHRIQHIDYVNTGQVRQVEFAYENRPDIAQGYVAGEWSVSDKRLKTVRTRVGVGIVKEYRLVYETGAVSFASRLASVTECGFEVSGVALCVPPTRFTWQEGVPGFKTGGSLSGSNLNTGYYWQADFDGDGRDEIASGAGGQISMWDYLGDQNDSGWFNLTTHNVTNQWGGSAYTKIGDFNGDGRADIASAAAGNVFMKFGESSGFTSETWAVTNAWGGGGYTWAADFNADGLTDIASASGGTMYMKLSTGSGFTSANWPVQNAWGAADKTWVADFTGDGLPDIASVSASGGTVNMKLGTGTGFVSQTWGVTNNWADARHTWVSDLNGDGKADIITGTGASLNVKLSTGSTFSEITYTVPGFPAGYTISHMFDYNGDGLLDIALDNYSTVADGLVAINQGNGFKAPVSAGTLVRFTYNPENIFFGDMNGDGFADRTTYSGSTLTTKPSSVAQEAIDTIAPGVGSKVSVTYAPLPQVYGASGTCPGYPVKCTPSPLNMVYEHYSDNGVGGISRYTYTFSGTRLHVRGRGFLGFDSKDVVDRQNGIFVTTSYANDIAQTVIDTYPDRYPYAGMASQMTAVERRVGIPGSGVSNITYDSMDVTQFSLEQTANGTYFPYARVKVENNRERTGDLVSTTTTTTDYDTNGNVTQITAQTVGNAETFTKTTVNQYDLADLRLGRLTRATVTSATPDGIATRTSGFTYYSNGLLKQEIIEPDEPDTSLLKQVTEYEYDSFGNKTKVSVTALASDSPASGLQTRTTQTRYDSIGLFPVRTINSIGHDEHYTYDPRFGLKTQLIGPNQLPTTWEYDALGRPVREARADGTVTTTDFAWCPSSVCPNGGTQVISKTSGSARTVVYRDAQDREIRAETEGIRPGVPIYQDTEYDKFGRIYRKSRPYYAGGTPQWATFTYDLFDRVTTESLPDGGQVVYTYAPLTKTTTTSIVGGDVAQIAKTERFDAMGRLRQVDEELGITTTFQYDSQDNLTTVTDDAGNVTTTQYDRRGRKTRMNDPGMGQWDYRYNGFGELTFQQDNKLQQVTMVYDALGRMINRSEPEGTTTWTYDTAPRGKGKLAQVNAPNNFARTLSYDGLGRIATDARIITGQTFQTAYSFDRFGRVIETTYPSGFITRNVYNTNGILVEVRNAANDTLYWQAGDADADGQLTQETYGNNLQTLRTYDPASGRVAVITTGIGTASDIQFLDYSFDTVGNLQQRSRSEGTTNLTETFDYDALNRLKLASISGIGNKNYSYDSLGNITQKGTASDYRYAERGAGPHAVTYANGQNYDYDANGNMKTGAGRTLTWSSYNKPTQIQKGQTTVQFDYGPDRARFRQVKTIGSEITTTVYIGKLYEEISKSGQVERKHYIMAGGRAIAIYSDKGAGQTSTQYLHHDHLGSVDVITDASGAVVERLSFAAFGARRNSNWTDATGLITSQFTTRGFTGHEQLDEVGLVHMNGRVYDPGLGRFLSADPQVQFPASSQSHNRYSYVLNNPLSYTDPSGFGLFSKIKKAFKKVGSAIKKIAGNAFVRTALAIVASYYTFGYVGLLTSDGFLGAAAAGFAGGLIGTGTLKGAAIGAVTGAAFYGVGSYFQYAAKLKGAASWQKGQLWFGRIVAHGAVGGASSAAQGGSFADGFRSAAFTQFGSPVIGSVPGDTIGRTAAAAVVGGTASKLGGGKFANGAVTGAFSRLFNDEAHDGGERTSIRSVKKEWVLISRGEQILRFEETSLLKRITSGAVDIFGAFSGNTIFSVSKVTPIMGDVGIQRARVAVYDRIYENGVFVKQKLKSFFWTDQTREVRFASDFWQRKGDPMNSIMGSHNLLNGISTNEN